MGNYVQYDFSEFRAFFEGMRKAKEGFQEEAETWLEAIGEDFLKEVQEQVIAKGAKDTSYMLHTFERGQEHNFWEMQTSIGTIQLEVGTSLDYAIYSNNGHRQQPGRFVPGYWETSADGKERFVYDPQAEGGMVLKLDWVEGKHFFDKAEEIYTPIFEKSFERKLEQWLPQYFEM